MRLSNWMRVSILVAVTSACASLPLKQQATLSLQATHTVLAAGQDLELKLWAAQTQPDLTLMVHRKIHAALADAFEAEARATVVLKAWNAGDPVPKDLTEMMAGVRRAMRAVEEVTFGAERESILGKLREGEQKLSDILTLIGGIQ